MEWTDEKPTEPGWYWLRKFHIRGMSGVNFKTVIACVTRFEDCPLEFTLTGNDGLWGVDDCEGQWSGPLAPPQ